MYNLQPELAKKADTIGAYLSETGKYVGTFIRAEKLISANKGTDGIGFTFKDDLGRSCRFDVWTQKQDGTALSGLNQVNAMMACLQLRGLKDTPQNVSKWDNNANAETVQSAPCFADLMNKRVGLLLRAEEYAKMKDNALTGDYGWRMGLFAIFQAETELMASEIMSRKTKPEQLAKVIEQLADKPVKKTPTRSSGAVQGYQGGTGSHDFADDDLPPF
jgi:hypothetical protein